MAEANKNKTQWLHLRLSPDEHKQITAEFKKTTCRKLSDYARRVLLGKPIIAAHRNKSMDDLMAELIQLRMELNSIGNNFNQVVKKLHSTPQTSLIATLLYGYEQDKKKLIDHVAAIQSFIENTEQKW